MKVILALDPGGTSGIALGWFGLEQGQGEGVPVFRSYEAPTLDALLEVELFLQSGGDKAVVCESWTPRPGIRTFQPEALESIGAARYLCWRYRTPFQLQSPAEAKRFATNEKLATLGWRNPSKGGHADDAARHLLVAAVKQQLIDPAVFVR